jgi:uncharacterized RDD family membrane protein YckC
MGNEYTEIMKRRPDEELIEITSANEGDYKPEAIEAAQEEIESRNINTDKKIEIEESLHDSQVIDNNTASSGVRFLNLFIDFIAFLITFVILGTILDIFIVATELTSWMLLTVTFFGYYIILEYKYQKTVGKFLTKTKVVMKDGSSPELGDIVRRTFCRIIPFDLISFLFTKNGFHDYLSNTTVIK